MIQHDGKGKDYSFRWFSRLYSSENKFGRRREYVIIARNILMDMGKMDKAAAFANQAESCINRTSNDDFENCLKIFYSNNYLGKIIFMLLLYNYF